MTRQILDTVVYNDVIFQIQNPFHNGGLTPEYFGMTATAIGTSNWRGYYANYQIENQKLYLTDFALRSVNGYPEIEGKYPVLDSLGRNQYHYRGLTFEAKLNINLLIGHSYASAGLFFLKYKTLKGLHFRDGQLVKEVDYSRFGQYMRMRYRWAKLFGRFDMKKHYQKGQTKIPLDEYGYEGVYERMFGEKEN